MSLAEYGWMICTDPNPENTWGPQEYKIMHDGSGGGTFAPEGSNALLTYMVDYIQTEDFIDTVLGKSVKNGAMISRSQSGGVGASLPEPHPYYENFFAVQAEVTPKGKSSNNSIYPQWMKSEIAVTFRPLDYLPRDDSTFVAPYDTGRFISGKCDTSVELLTLPNRKMFWVTASTIAGVPVPLDTRLSTPIPSLSYTFTWHKVPVNLANANPLAIPPNINEIKDLLGKVNSDTIFGFPRGTVLFKGCVPKLVMPSVASQNNYMWDIEYVFGVRDYGFDALYNEEIGWDHAFYTQPGGGPGSTWDLITTNGADTGTRNYQKGDLRGLFQATW